MTHAVERLSGPNLMKPFRRGNGPRIVVVCLVFLVVPVWALAQSREAFELLDAIEEANRSMPPYAMTLNYVDEGRYEGDPRPDSTVVSTIDVRRDGTRLDKREVSEALTGERARRSQSRHNVWNGSEYWFYSHANDDAYSNAHAVTSNREPESRFDQVHFGLELTGNFHNESVHYASIMRDAASLVLLPEMEQVDGHDCYVLESTSEYGRHKVWVDPDHGYNYRRVVVEKNRDDLGYGDKALERQGSPLLQTSYRIDNVTIREVDGYHIVDNAVVTSSTEYQEGFTFILESKVSVQPGSVQFNPDFEALGAFRIDDIRYGTPVWVTSEPGVRYVWHDGVVAPFVDIEQMDSLDGVLASLSDDLEPAAGSLTDSEMRERMASVALPVADEKSGTDKGITGILAIVAVLSVVAIAAATLVVMKRGKMEG